MNQVATLEQKQLTASQQFRVELDRMGDQFAAALPSHIKPEKFQRVVMTAVLSDPDILKADRKSLMESAIRAAQDGLLPDKREGAFVVFNTKIKVDGKDQWVKAVQWMPMVGGIIKRIHQSGEIKMLTARVVYGGDHFRTWIDDTGEHVEYEPSEDQDTEIVRRVFAMATTVDGAVYVEPLSVKDVEKIRSVSRGKERGPWSDWWEEMAKKSAIRRLAKRLPLSVDMHDLIQRDNALFDLDREPDVKQPSVMQRLRAAKPTQDAEDHQEGFNASFTHPDTANALDGEILTENETPESGSSPSSSEPVNAEVSPPASAEPVDTVPLSTGSQPIDDDLRTHLMDFARKALRTAEDDLPSAKKLDLIEDMLANYREVIPEQEWGKLSTIKVSIQAVLAGKRTIDQARKFIAGDLLGCDPSDIGG